MKLRLQISPKAQVDLDAYRIHLWLEAGEEIADRFCESARRTMESLLDFPNRGAESMLGQPLMWTLRWWPVEGFPRVHLFYRVTSETVDIVRILSADRDLDALLLE